MIEVLNYSLIESTELLTLGKGVNNIFVDFDVEDGNIALIPFVKFLRSSYLDYSKAYEREATNPYTTKLEGANNLRGNAFLCFRSYILSCTFNEAATEVEAAKRIIRVIVKHGWSSASFGYKKETAAITNITNEIKDFYMSDIQLLVATSRFDRLVTRETGFESVQKESVTQPPSDLPTITDTRPKMIDALRKLFTTIDNLHSVDSTDTVMEGYVNSLSELITLTMSTARSNKTRKENDEKEEDPKV